MVGGNNSDATLHGLVEYVLANHVVALNVHYVRLDFVEQETDFLLDFPREADAEVFVREHPMRAEAVDGCLVTELGVALARVRTASQHVHVVSARRHPLGRAVAELRSTVYVRRVGVRRDQDGKGFVGVGNGHVENS